MASMVYSFYMSNAGYLSSTVVMQVSLLSVLLPLSHLILGLLGIFGLSTRRMLLGLWVWDLRFLGV